jgi:hypothetical protein
MTAKKKARTASVLRNASRERKDSMARNFLEVARGRRAAKKEKESAMPRKSQSAGGTRVS